MLLVGVDADAGSEAVRQDATAALPVVIGGEKGKNGI
jgi:hypothetical protein